MKVVFLDFDGVLNSAAWMKESFLLAGREKLSFLERDARELSPAMVRRVLKIIEATDAAVVISSSWRILHSIDELKEILTVAGFPQFGQHIIDATPKARVVEEFGIPRDTGIMRGHEIEHWINEFEKKNGRLDSFVILDDDSDMLSSQKANFVQTNWEVGITDEHVERAIKILGASHVAV